VNVEGNLCEGRVVQGVIKKSNSKHLLPGAGNQNYSDIHLDEKACSEHEYDTWQYLLFSSFFLLFFLLYEVCQLVRIRTFNRKRTRIQCAKGLIAYRKNLNN